jgi:hypothetical protein
MDDPSVGQPQSPHCFWIQKTKTYVLSKFWSPKATFSISKVSVERERERERESEWVRVSAWVWVCARVDVHACVRARVCVHACMVACVCVCVCVCVWVRERERPILKQNVVQTYFFFHASNFLGTSKLQVEWKSLSMHYSIATCYNPIPSREGFSGLLYQHLAIEVNASDSSASVSVQKLLYSAIYCLWPLVHKVIT